MTDFHRKKIQARNERRGRTRRRVRGNIRGSAERPRLSVHKSLKYVSAQLIDDDTGRTLAAATSLEKDLRSELDGKTAGMSAAKRVGEAIAERAKTAGVEAVVFDRGRYRYHGKVKELADAAREKGLRF